LLACPQLATGTLSQFPVQRRHRMRTLVNTAADGTVVKLADAGAETVEWQLKYAELSDGELAALLEFFSAAEGTLNNFTFVDPTANLLAWSNDLSNAVWDTGPFLSSTASNADPCGGNKAWQVANSGAGAQGFSQTVAAPGGYLYCFSVYAKSAIPTANLLAWSNDLSNAVWDTGPFLSSTASNADPCGGNKAWQVANSGAGAQGFSQTVAAPG